MKFGERLLKAGLIDKGQLDAALSHQRETGQLIGEALLELGYVSEENLLKFLAKEYNTRFVSTRKLSRISISGELLELVPQGVAEKAVLFPVMINHQKGVLGIVTADPQKEQVVEELKIVSRVNEVQVYVAARDAVLASIKKHYKGDIHAFAALDKSSQQQQDQMMELYSDRVLPVDDVQDEPQAAPAASGPAVVDLDPAEGFTSEATSSWTRQIEAVRGGSLVSDNDFIETLNILIGLLEMQRSSMQGHSAKVAKWTKVVSERMGLKERDINHNIIAAYLHDLGKRSSAHLTLMSIAQSEDHRRRAKRYHLTPARLFDSVHLPPQVNHIIGHLYESYDGTGLPEQLSGEGIPSGAKIIAVVDAFEDLISNSTNPLGKQLEAEDALTEIRTKAERLFDPQIVELLAEVVVGEAARAQLSSSSPLVLVADADNASTSVIELKLVKRGFHVRVARDSETAKESLRAENVAAMLLEMRLEPEDGFAILKFLQTEGKVIPVFMVSTEAPPEAVTRAFEAGVADFITKPFMPEVILAKLQKELRSQPTQAAVTQPGVPDTPEDEEEFSTGVVINLDGDLESAMSDAENALDLPDDTGDTLDLPDDPGDTLELGGDVPTLGPEDEVPMLGPDDEVPILPQDNEVTPTDGTPLPSREGSDQFMPQPPTGTMAGVVSTGSKILSGTLEGKNALTLIRAISGKRKTGLLSLRLGDEKGMIYFEKGHVFQAMVGEVQAEEAFLELAAWADCLYKFDPSKTAKARVVKTSTGKLIQIAGMQ